MSGRSCKLPNLHECLPLPLGEGRSEGDECYTSQLPLKRLIENGRQQRLQLGGGLRLQGFEAIDFSLQAVEVSDDAALFVERRSKRIAQLFNLSFISQLPNFLDN